MTGLRLENGVMISKKARNSQNFVAMMQFIDWLWYSDAGEDVRQVGRAGRDLHRTSSTATFKLAPDVNWVGPQPQRHQEPPDVDYGFFNGVFAYGGSSNLLDSSSRRELAFQNVMNDRKTLAAAAAAPVQRRRAGAGDAVRDAT